MYFHEKSKSRSSTPAVSFKFYTNVLPDFLLFDYSIEKKKKKTMDLIYVRTPSVFGTAVSTWRCNRFRNRKISPPCPYLTKRASLYIYYYIAVKTVYVRSRCDHNRFCFIYIVLHLYIYIYMLLWIGFSRGVIDHETPRNRITGSLKFFFYNFPCTRRIQNISSSYVYTYCVNTIILYGNPKWWWFVRTPYFLPYHFYASLRSFCIHVIIL